MSVVSISPTSGSTAGGTSVTITGTGLSTANVVLFGGVGATPQSSSTADTIYVTAPAQADAGPVAVDVNLPTGKIPAPAFTYVAPSVQTLVPAGGSTAGNTLVTITGTLLGATTTVLFGTVGAPPLSVTDTEVTVLSPAAQPAGITTVSLNLPTGPLPAGSFTYGAPPVVTGISPASGPNAGGTQVTITGTGLDLATVMAGPNPATLNDTTLTFTSPPGSGTVDVVVSTAFGSSALTGADQFQYATLPFNFTIPAGAASHGGGVFLTMYGQLAAAYTNGAGTAMAAGDNVYLTATTDGGYDYTPTVGVPIGNSLEPALATTTALVQAIQLPNVALNAGRFVIGVGAAPVVPVNDATGDVTGTTPVMQGSNIYDFFEFSYLPVAGRLTLTINTSAIDQFGLPIILQAAGQLVMPAGQVGVELPCDQVIGADAGFASAVTGTPYLSLTEDAFGKASTVRILSPKSRLGDNPVQGLTATAGTPTGTLAADTTYSYVLTAVTGSAEAPAACALAQATTSTGTIEVSWSPSTMASVSSYKLYRATPNGSSLSWDLVATQAAADAATYLDTGTDSSTAAPGFEALATYFDTAIGDLFTLYDGAPNTINLTVTDGSSPANGLQYSFTGTAMAAPDWLNAPGNTVLQFACTAIGNNPNGTPPLLPKGTLLYVTQPFFNTNTQNPGKPTPPSWIPNAGSFPTNMAFSAMGVFADNAPQANALYQGSAQPAGVDQAALSVAIGAIEDQIDAALLRGIATTVNAVNWANAPTNLTAAATPGTSGGLPAGQAYYYVVTALNEVGETSPSNEACCQTTTGSVTLGWAPVAGATGYNVYRGTVSGEENTLIAAGVGGTTVADDTADPAPSTVSPPTAGAQTAPTVLAATGLAGGALEAGQTYFYVVTALGLDGESSASAAASAATTAGNQSIALTWSAAENTAAYKIYRGTASGQETQLIGTSIGTGCSFTDAGSAAQVPPPVIYYAPGTVCDLYGQYFHQPTVSYGGLCYAAPFDDQGGQSSTIAAASPQSVQITLGAWI